MAVLLPVLLQVAKEMLAQLVARPRAAAWDPPEYPFSQRPAVVDDEERPMATAHNEPPLSLQLVKTPREREFPIRCVHCCTAVAPFGLVWYGDYKGTLAEKREAPACSGSARKP